MSLQIAPTTEADWEKSCKPLKQNFHSQAKSIPSPAALPKSFHTAWGIPLTFCGKTVEERRKMGNDSVINTLLLIQQLSCLMDRQGCSAQRNISLIQNPLSKA